MSHPLSCSTQMMQSSPLALPCQGLMERDLFQSGRPQGPSWSRDGPGLSGLGVLSLLRFALHPNYAQQLASGVCPSHLNHCGIGSQCLSFHYCPLRPLPGCACRSQAGPGSPRRYEPLGKRTREVTGGTQDWIQAKAALQTEVQTLRHCCGACSGHQASAD